MNSDWYVYYRARVEDARLLQERVRAMHSRLQRSTRIHCSLKKRYPEDGEQNTWMEVYLAVPDNFEMLLAQEVLAARLGELIVGERHKEHFMDVTTCA
jgi:hypothetical protein